MAITIFRQLLGQRRIERFETVLRPKIGGMSGVGPLVRFHAA